MLRRTGCNSAAVNPLWRLFDQAHVAKHVFRTESGNLLKVILGSPKKFDLTLLDEVRQVSGIPRAEKNVSRLKTKVRHTPSVSPLCLNSGDQIKISLSQCRLRASLMTELMSKAPLAVASNKASRTTFSS